MQIGDVPLVIVVQAVYLAAPGLQSPRRSECQTGDHVLGIGLTRSEVIGANAELENGTDCALAHDSSAPTTYWSRSGRNGTSCLASVAQEVRSVQSP